MEPQPPAKHPTPAVLAILAVSAFAFFFGLGQLGFLGPDEPRYVEVAREMFASGDYISTRLSGCLWFEKPALVYWLSAAGYHLFGVNEFAARAPIAATALATVALLCFALRRLDGGRVALAAALVLATSGIFIAYARVATPDMVLTAAITASLLAGFYATRAGGRLQLGLWVTAFLFMGVAVLAKGLVGAVLVIAILGTHLLFAGQLRSVRWRDLLAGVAVFLAVAGIWYGPVIVRHGWAFIEEFFIRHHFTRYTSNEFGHPQPVYFFVLVAFAGMAPWCFFLIPAIGRLRSLGSSRYSLLVLAWIWAVIPIVFFSFSESKLPGYILPSVPALAVILGAEVERFWSGERSRLMTAAAWLTALMLLGMSIGFLVFVRSEAVSISGWRLFLDGLPLAVALISVVALVAQKGRVLVAGAAGVVISVVLAAVILLFPTLQDEVTLKSLSIQAAAALRPGEKIAFYLKKEFAPVFYAEGRVLCEPRRGGTFYALHQNMLAEALESESTLIVITDTRWLEGLEQDPRFITEFIAAQGESLALRVVLKK
ncbi:MAG TPA: glycosyltransferase family 39 protein [Blastocatellia bacterium]|nr:glycosyltransferase family 39 protein [Blastocatellia bacterium]